MAAITNMVGDLCEVALDSGEAAGTQHQPSVWLVEAEVVQRLSK